MTREGFDLLLTQLDAEREKAGEKYEVLRRKLIKFFAWWGSDDNEVLADEAFDRVARKLAEGEAVRDLNGYLMGVARLIFKEHVRGQIRMRASVEQLPREPSTADDPVNDEARHDCYENCLGKLPPQSRDFVIQYYQMHGRDQAQGREGLAVQMQIPLNLLRVRAFRIRKKLAECLEACLKNQTEEG